MTDRWEYQVIRHRDAQRQDDTAEWLNEFGNDGWELVQIGEPGFVFKRRLTEEKRT